MQPSNSSPAYWILPEPQHDPERFEQTGRKDVRICFRVDTNVLAAILVSIRSRNPHDRYKRFDWEPAGVSCELALGAFCTSV